MSQCRQEIGTEEHVKQFITPRQLCKELGLSLPSVYRGLRAGQIPGVLIGERWIIRREWFDEWVENATKRKMTAADATSAVMEGEE